MKQWQKAVGNAIIVASLGFFTQLAVQPQFPPTAQMIYSSFLMFIITFLTLCKGIFGSEGSATKEAKRQLAKGQKTLGKFKEKVSAFLNKECNDSKGGGRMMLSLWL